MKFNIFNLKKRRKRLPRKITFRDIKPIEFAMMFMPANPTSIWSPFTTALDGIVAKTYTEEEMDEGFKSMKPSPISFIISPRSPSIFVRNEEDNA